LKENRKSNWKADLANIRDSLVMMYRCDPKLFVAKLLITVIQSVLPLINLYVLKLLIDSVSTSIAGGHFDSAEALKYVLIFCGVFLLNRLMTLAGKLVNSFFTQKLSDYISNSLHQKSTELDLAYYDNSEYHDTFHRAQQEASYRPMQILGSFTSIIGSLISLAGTVVILASFSWLVIVVMIFACLPDFLVKLYKSRKLYYWNKEHTQLFRMANYLSALLTNRVSAKEIRTFGLAGYFRNKFNRLRKIIRSQVVRINMRLSVLDVLAIIFETVALFFIVFMLIRGTVGGAITIGSFVMLFEAFRRGQSYMESLINGITGLYDNKLFIRNLFEFLKLKPNIVTPANPKPFPQKILHGIEFRNVTFSYPDGYKNVLENFCLSVKPNSVTQIRGENGFGKTTLIKLLFRLYDCNEGGIYIDGTDIREFDLFELRKNISVIFQDFIRYNFTVKENIQLGEIDMLDEERIRQSAETSSADRFVRHLPHDYDTRLGKYFSSSEDLSMGQWQRVALARALYSKAPILVLDEPTSFMDAQSTRNFFAKLDELAQNRIVLLITHSDEL